MAKKENSRQDDPRYYPTFRAVRKRDGLECKSPACLYTGRSLQQHHINGWATNEELRFDPDNIITLCSNRKILGILKIKGCHQRFHADAGGTQIPVDRQKLDSWFNLEIMRRMGQALVLITLNIFLFHAPSRLV